MELNKKITGLWKQNEMIYNSLLSKNIIIEFEKVGVIDGINEEDYLELLNNENTKLKELVKLNKPPQQTKEIKVQIDNKEKKNTIVNNNEDNDEEINYNDPIKKFETLANMEEIKRAFFSSDYLFFKEELNKYPFKFYKADYKYNSDKDGAPDFSAKNLVKGFVRNFDDYRKYFMICFRCWKNNEKNEYKYESYWIVNTLENISNIIGTMSDDFIFEENKNIDEFLISFNKLLSYDITEEPVNNGFICISEAYVH
jgi:hypothetical protein